MKLAFTLVALSAVVVSVCWGEEGKDVYINNVSDFTDFYTKVNNGNDYSSTIIYLNETLDFNGTTIEPIGNKEDNPFCGTFDGQGYAIKNLTINSSEAYIGLFGYTKDATIKNVILDNSCFITSNYSGKKNLAGICGYCEGNCIIEGCINKVNITHSGSNSYVGGIIAYCGSENNYNNVCILKDNINYGSINYNGTSASISERYGYNENTRIGGVMGESISKLTVHNCVNFGDIVVYLSYSESWIGGVVGSCKSSSYNGNLSISNSINYGNIFVYGSSEKFNIGGILSQYADSGISISSCCNFGTITNYCRTTNPYSPSPNYNGYIGGIVGQGSNGYGYSDITGCISDGMIKGNVTGVTIGVISGSTTTKTNVSNCYYNEDICNVSGNACSNTGSSSPYNETNSSSVLNSIIQSANNNIIINENGATLTLVVNCEVTATLTSKIIALPSSSLQWYSNPECTNNFTANNITNDTTLYQRLGSYSDSCGQSSSSSSSFSSTSSSPSSSSSTPSYINPVQPISNSSVPIHTPESSSEYVEITFNKKDLNDNEIKQIINKFTDAVYTIEKIGDDDSDRFTVIIKFKDVEAATNFVETIKNTSNSDIDDIIYNISFISLSLSLVVSKIVVFSFVLFSYLFFKVNI